MNSKFISGPAAVLILILFFLPWVSVSCNGQTVGELSGYELATGIEAGSGTDLLSSEGVEGDASLLLIPLAAVLALALIGLAVYRPPWRAATGGGQIALALVGLGVLVWKWSALQNNQEALFEITILPALWGTAVAHLFVLIGGGIDLWNRVEAEDDLFGADDFVPVTPPSSPKPNRPSSRAESEMAPPRDYMATWVDGTEDDPVLSDSQKRENDLFDSAPKREKPAEANRDAGWETPSRETQLDWEADEPVSELPPAETPPHSETAVPPAGKAGDKTEVLFDPISGDAAPPPAWLVIREGTRKGEQFRLLPETGLGRESDNEIVLSDTAVSNHHARVIYKQKQFVYEDLGSTNGSYLYEPHIDHWRKIDTVELQDGMQIKVGRLVLHFMTV